MKQKAKQLGASVEDLTNDKEIQTIDDFIQEDLQRKDQEWKAKLDRLEISYDKKTFEAKAMIEELQKEISRLQESNKN